MRRARLRSSRWIAIAAVLIIGVSVWRVWDVYHAKSGEEIAYPGSSPRTMDTIYQVEKSRGFVPMWVCSNDKEFATEALVLDRGTIVFSGASRELLDAPDRLGDLLGVAAR